MQIIDKRERKRRKRERERERGRADCRASDRANMNGETDSQESQPQGREERKKKWHNK